MKKLSTDQARQGRGGRPVLVVLVVALALAAIAALALHPYKQDAGTLEEASQAETE